MIHNKNGDTQSYIVFSKCYFFGWTMLPKQSLSPSVTFNINPSHFDNNLISPYMFHNPHKGLQISRLSLSRLHTSNTLTRKCKSLTASFLNVSKLPRRTLCQVDSACMRYASTQVFIKAADSVWRQWHSTYESVQSTLSRWEWPSRGCAA